MPALIPTARKYKGWWLYPILNDDDPSVIDYWDIYHPSDDPFGTSQGVESHVVFADAKRAIERLSVEYKNTKKFFKYFGDALT